MNSHPDDPASYYRYCPGEERIRISDAVCRGRRRANFPKCKGCQFNDDEKAASRRTGEVVSITPAAATTPSAPRVLSTPPSKADLIERLFTPGDVRGQYPEPLDTDAAWRIGLATAQFLRSELRGYDRSRPEKSTVIVGRDMRKSSPVLADALIEGLRCGGAGVIDIGLIDTPQLYFAVNHLTCCGGVQVTAGNSHPSHNGFKICAQKGKRICADTGLTKIARIACNTQRHSTTQMGGLKQVDLTDSYREFLRGFLREEAGTFSVDRPLKLVVDASNGMAGRWLPLVLGDVPWIEMIRLNFEHNGEFLHEPDPAREENLAQACDRVIRSRADLGVCFDDDADRCIFIDGDGRPVPGDLLTALLAPAMLRQAPGATVVYDVRSSRVVAEEVRKAGGVPRRERCGQAHIRKTLADGKGIFGGELNGHYYFRDNWYCASAMIALIEVINLLDQTGQPLGDLIAGLRRYPRSGPRDIAVDHPQAVLEEVARHYTGAEIDYLDGLTVQHEDWWFNLRPSRFEPVLRLNMEAISPALLEQKLQELAKVIGRPLQGAPRTGVAPYRGPSADGHP